MPQDIEQPQDDGHIGLPPVTEGMNRTGPAATAPNDTNLKRMSGEEEQKFLAKARKRFQYAEDQESNNRKSGMEDVRFKVGEQWDQSIQAQRQFDKRPCLTVNKVPVFVRQITNEQRMNRPQINANPIGDQTDKEAAKLYSGMFRAIERDSAADIAYDTAFECAASIGWGYWRLLTEYERPDSFDQVIRIKRVRNPFTVYLDPNHTDPTGADAKWGFISEMIPREQFVEEWPDADPIPWTQQGAGEAYKNWFDQKQIRIAEYFEVEYEGRALAKLRNGHVGWKDLLAKSALREIIEEREAFIPSVWWYKLTAKEVLQHQKWPGEAIPIVKIVGNETDVEGKVNLSGVIRDMRDAQRMYNYWVTSETEAIALAPKAPWVMAEGQDEGYEEEWQNANTKTYSVLFYKQTDVGGQQAPPPQRQPLAGPAAGVIAAKQGAAQDMMATSGIRFDATPQERMYDESGRALRELRRSGDIGTFHYMDNLARSLRRCGELMIDLIPKVYVTPRIMTILRENDAEEAIRIDPTAAKAMSETRHQGKTMKVFNPTVGRYGVTVTVGPSYATKRIEAAESMMDFVRALPQTAQVIADLVAKNMDWPGADEIAARLAKLLPPGINTPEMKDVPPQVQAMLQQMQQELQKMAQQNQQLMAAMADKTAAQDLARQKLENDFEAKLLGIAQKQEAMYGQHVGSQLKDLAEAVRMLRDQFGGMRAAA